MGSFASVNRIILSLISVGFILGVLGQVVPSSEQLDFEEVEASTQKTIEVSLRNNNAYTVSLTEVFTFSKEFSCSTTHLNIEPQQTKNIEIAFTPRHNITHNSEVVFMFSNGELLSIDVLGQGVYNEPYYVATRNKSYEDLKVALKGIVSSGYVNLGYNGARDKMYGEIDNVGGKVTCVYAGREATFSTRSGANTNNFNCEHTWPQSLFNKNEPERADIHHLFPTDVTSNSKRGSYPFGEVSNATWSSGGSKLGGGKFEPRNEQKGATARAMLYFAIRYTDYDNFIDNQEEILREWHFEYLPSQQEEDRNDAIFKYQKNRNPFVDHPEFLERINTVGSFDARPAIYTCEPVIDVWYLKGLSNEDTRTFYAVNSGNENVTVRFVGATYLQTVFSSEQVQPGEAANIPFSFGNLSDGNYRDTLKIIIEGVTSTTHTVIVPFSMGKVSNSSKENVKPKAYFQASNQTLYLENLPKAVQNVSIYDNSGRRISLNERTSLFTDIPLSYVQPGVYFVVIQTRDKAYTAKFLVKE